MQAAHEVAQVLDWLGDGVEHLGLNEWQLRTLKAVRLCRTAALGGHIDECDACGKLSISYNSCRNRHCPKCQGHKREAWIAAREQELLAVPYFHLVFTLPQELNVYALHQPKHLYDALFKAAWQTLAAFGTRQGLQMGMIAILHTWGQTLSRHPHLHCIVPGGGVDAQGHWSNVRADGKFLFPVKALSKVFRAKFLAEFGKSQVVEQGLRQCLFEKDWIVYAKRPFGSPKSVLEYLGRYTHKIAISNHRIQSVDDEGVRFSYKAYQEEGKTKSMRLSQGEFVRRFAQHILPKGFVKIRHYGFLSSTWKPHKLKALRADLGLQPVAVCVETHHRRCPCCQKGRLVTLYTFGKRGPPSWFKSSDSQPEPCREG